MFSTKSCGLTVSAQPAQEASNSRRERRASVSPINSRAIAVKGRVVVCLAAKPPAVAETRLAPKMVYNYSVLPKLNAAFYAQLGSEPPSQPVRAWLKRLPEEERKEIGTGIQSVQFGWPLKRNEMKHSKSIRPEHVGQDFDEFSADEGIAAEVEARAIKKLVIALLGGMGLTQAELAQRLETSRTQVRRLLDPDYTTITLSTLQRAAGVAGHRLVIGFEPARSVEDTLPIRASKTPQRRRGNVTAS